MLARYREVYGVGCQPSTQGPSMSINPEDSPTHRLLVDAALYYLAGAENVRARGRETLDDPEPVGGHVPDVSCTQFGRLILAEAMTGPELLEPESVDKLAAFCRGEGEQRPAFHIFVPEGWEDRARDAIGTTGFKADDDLIEIHGVGGLEGPSPP